MGHGTGWRKTECGVRLKTIEDKPSKKAARGGRYGTAMEERRNTQIRPATGVQQVLRRERCQ